MNRALFVLEFRRVFLPTLAYQSAIVGTLWVVGKLTLLWRPDTVLRFGKTSQEIMTGIDLVALIILIASGFISGRAAFNQEFKKSYYLLLRSLPLDKGSAWAIVFLANLASAFLSFGLVVALRPSIIANEPGVISWLLGAYLLLFSAGSCYSLLFRTAPVSLAVGFLWTVAAASISLLVELSSRWYPSQIGHIPRFVGPSELNLVYWGVLLALFIVFSYRFFVTGEFDLFRRRLKNTSILLCSQLCLFVGLVLLQDSGAFSLFDKWVPAGRYYGSRHIEVSHNGEYLAVLESRRRQPQFGRIQIISVKEGQLLGEVTLRGISEMGWSLDDKSLTVVQLRDSASERLGYLLPPSDSLVWFSPQGRPLGDATFPSSRIVDASFDAALGNLVITQRQKVGKLSLVHLSTNEIEELAAGPVEFAYFEKHKDQHLAYFNSESEVLGFWSIPPDGRKPSWTRFGTSYSYPVNGVVYSSMIEARSQIAKLYPFSQTRKLSGTPQHVGMHVLPRPLFDESVTLFYLRTFLGANHSELWVFDRIKKAWLFLTSHFPVNHKELEHASGSPAGGFFRPFYLVPWRGLAAYQMKENARTAAFLYDAAIERPIHLGSVENAEADVTIKEVMGTGLFLVQFYKGRFVEYNPKPNTVIKQYIYLPASGVLRPLPASFPEFNQIFYADRNGNTVVEESQARRILFIGASGEQRRLWPLDASDGQ